jgi:glutamate 5-kinase
MHRPVLVFKIGTSSITTENGEVDVPLLEQIAEQLANLHSKYDIVIVSSGAVGTGKRFIHQYSGKIEERKAAAAIGNPILISKYSKAFSPYNIPIAQSLCERQHFSNRHQFLQLRETYRELWKNGVIPIANENDVVSNLELCFSDNDELATLLAVGFGAEVLLIATSVQGVLDKDGEVVRKISSFDSHVMSLASKEKSSGGLGGMISKLTYARLATSMGIRVVIFNARLQGNILQALKGEAGTDCPPKEATANARQKWLASGSIVNGRLMVDEGARKALQARKSLLAVGVKEVLSPFEKGEVFDMVDETGRAFAVGLAKISSTELQGRSGEQKLMVAGADDIVFI